MYKKIAEALIDHFGYNDAGNSEKDRIVGEMIDVIQEQEQKEESIHELLADIKQLESELDDKKDKFAHQIQMAFAEGKRIEVSGNGYISATYSLVINGTFVDINNAYIYTRLYFAGGEIRFSDDSDRKYQIKISNIESITINDLGDIPFETSPIQIA